MQRFLLSGVVALPALVAAQWHNVDYPALTVWPMPRNVTLPAAGAAAGPHAVDAATAKVTIDTACGDAVHTLVNEALSLPTTHFRAPVRTYNEAAYGALDNASCARRCVTDFDCGEPQQGDGITRSRAEVCYIRSDLRWSSTVPCSPSSASGLNAACGCCVAAVPLPTIPAVVVRCNATAAPRAGAAGGPAAGAVDESYTLTAAPTGITIAAVSPHGAAAGVATLSQLLRYDSDLGTLVADVLPLRIADAPAFAWRGYMVDTSRHFVPVDDLLRTVDAMAAAKFNVFHWHVVDSPSFPLESAAYPELAQEGSWSRSEATTYSAADVAAVVARGAARFVQVVVEVDTPAHTLAVARSHPEMMAGQGCWEWMADSGFKVDVDSDDCMALDPTNAAAREMVATLLAEVAEAAGPAADYVHIGGDEVKYGCWNASARIQEQVAAAYGNLSSAAFARLQAEWTANVSAAAVVKAGKTPVLWQPTAEGPGDAAWDDALPPSSVYMVWLNSASAAAYAKAGKRVVYTTPYYVAGMGSNGWLDVYNAPLMPTGLAPAAQANILGGEVCAWGESLAAGNLAFRAVTIGAGAAETFWGGAHAQGSGPGNAAGLGLSDRFNRFLCHTQRFGVDSPPIMPSFCEVLQGS